MFNKRKKKIKAVPDKGRSPKGMIQDHSTERHKIIPKNQFTECTV